MAITKQKYIIGSTLQTPTPWNKISFFGSGTNVGQIVLNFQALVTAAGGILETALCTQNSITGLQNIPGVLDINSGGAIANSFQVLVNANGGTLETVTCTTNSITGLLAITS
jgi:hypothetical protein